MGVGGTVGVGGWMVVGSDCVETSVELWVQVDGYRLLVQSLYWIRGMVKILRDSGNG